MPPLPSPLHGRGLGPHPIPRTQPLAPLPCRVFSFLLVLLVVLLPAPVSASIYKYDDQPLGFGELIFRHSGMFAPAAGSGQSSYIRLSLHIVARSHMLVGTRVQASVMRQQDFESIGYVPAGETETSFCCDARAVEDGFCKAGAEGSLIMTGDATVHDIVLGAAEGGIAAAGAAGAAGAADTGNASAVGTTGATGTATAAAPAGAAKKEIVFEVTADDTYYSVISSCDPTDGTIEVAGVSEWKNPHGYLPGELFGNLPFWGAMLGVYGAMALFWFVLNVRVWQQLQHVQMWISAVVAVSLTEALFCHQDYTYLNANGFRSNWLMAAGALAMVGRKTLSHVLVLLVGTGWGITRATLNSTTKSRVRILAVIYGVVAFVKVRVRLEERLREVAQRRVGRSERRWG